ncbi:hypothetical protein [Pigmentiphaga kullae]|uniref:Uncharacterized protein n=1 Tax=Pigmentiphaga kullae TaxID=151784 RepID=A0A4Q7NC63_9BURK|nr:hypothetical protein [Pigmentiphaga kullae]RZS80611.1 hypothetical protein EV675_3223 [Pigmentiphaga kullae]
MTLDKETWIDRCAQRYIDRANIPKKEALEWAEAAWENHVDDDESPEDAADVDMSYWEE